MKKFLFVFPVLLSFTVFAQLKDTVPIKASKLTNRVFKNLRISNTPGNGIELLNCTNIVIENCTILNTAGNGIEGFGNSGVTIRNCVFENNQAGVYLISSTKVIVENNNFKNVRGPMPRGEAVQFNAVTGAGNRIACNHIVNEWGKSDPQDAINLYKSSGTIASPILVENNYINGGGPSKSGGGIMIADDGGSNILARGNVLVNPGQYGMSIVSGSNNVIENNKIYAGQQSFTNVGIALWQAYKNTKCDADNKILNNHVYWINSAGAPNPFWTDGRCKKSVISGNVWQSTQVSESMPAPSCAGVQGIQASITFLKHVKDEFVAANNSVVKFLSSLTGKSEEY